MYVNRYLGAISFALLAATTKACISTHNWNVSKRVVAELNYRTPLFSSSSPPRQQTTLHPKGKLLMALNMFVYKKTGQATKCFEETGNRSCNWVRLLLHKQATNCKV
jgi:transposase